MIAYVDHPAIEPSERSFEEAKISVQVEVIQQLNERLMWNLDRNEAAMKYVTSGLRQTCRDLFEGEGANQDVVALLRSGKSKEAASKLVELLLTEEKTLAA